MLKFDGDENHQDDGSQGADDQGSDGGSGDGSGGNGGSDAGADGSDDGETVTLTKAQLEERDKATRKDQDKRWKDRMKKAQEGDDGDDDQGDAGAGGSEGRSEVETERLDRMDLRSEGIKDKKEQDVIIDYARFKKISVLDAMNTPAVKAELKAVRDKSSTPSPSRRTGGTDRSSDVEYWADQFNKGRSAPTREMRQKVRAYLRDNK